jgi:hypothetical protein
MNLLLLLAPAFASNFLVLPTSIAMLLLALWFLIRGVDAARWEARIATVR